MNIDGNSNLISDDFWTRVIDIAIWWRQLQMNAVKYCASCIPMRNAIPNASNVVFYGMQIVNLFTVLFV